MTGDPIVIVVDDDPSVRSSLKLLVSTVGLKVESFESAEAVLERTLPDTVSCFVLDVRLRGLSGLDFQCELAAKNIRIPVIFITGHGDIPMSVRAMKAGAVEFLTKPFRDQDLLDAIHVSLERDRARRQQESELMKLEERLLSLTARERELLPLIVSGRPNKEIANEIGTSEITVKVHRANVMKKMHAESFADLIRIAGKLNIPCS